MMKSDRSTMQTLVAVPLSLFLIAGPVAAICQTPVQAVTSSSSPQSPRRPLTTAELSRGVGLNGILTQPADIARWKLVKDELGRRATIDRNWDAMYAMGREAEFPSIKGTAPNWNDASWWYAVGARDGSYAAKWHLGSLYDRGLVPGPPDRATGRADMQSALNHGYNPTTDSYDVTPASNNAGPALAALAVLAGLLVLSQGGSTTTSNSKSDSDTCTIMYQTHQGWVPDNSASGGSYSTQTRLRPPGAACVSTY